MVIVTEIVAKKRRSKKNRSKNRKQNITVKVDQKPNASQSRKRKSKKKAGSKSIMSEYLATLLDPENIAGAKVPDLINFPTGTFQLTYDNTLTVAASPADGVAFLVTPNLNVANQLSTGANVAAGGIFTYTSNPLPGLAQAVGIYKAFRPVSGIIYAEYTGTTLADSGTIVGALLPRSTSTPTTYTSAIAQPYSKSLPVRGGIVVRWKPEDNADYEFGSLQVPPSVFFCTSGMQPGASLKIRAVFNFEGIPGTDVTTFVNAAPSTVDLAALESTTRYLGNEGLYSYVQPFINFSTPFSNVPQNVARMSTTAATIATGMGYLMSQNLRRGVRGNSLAYPGF